MAALTPECAPELSADLLDALQITTTVNARKTVRARDHIFDHWTRFCASLNVARDLSDVLDPEGEPDKDAKLAYLLVYGVRLRRTGRAGKPIRADTIQDILLAVGKGITDLGEPDPRREIPGSPRYHPLLADFLEAMRKEDDPSTRAYPANITILRNLLNVLDVDHPTEGLANRHTIELIIVGFYWLLRPAEYLDAEADRSQAFKLQDLQFTIDGQPHLATVAPLNDVTIGRITHATLTFTDQKNAVRGEQITHQATNDPILCPCKALARLARHLRRFNAPGTAPLYQFYDRGTVRHVPPAWVTTALRYAAADLFPLTGIDPQLISARSLRPGGATAMLCAGIDADHIKLVGRWRSDAMLRYLRASAATNTKNFSQRMLDAGSYTFAPGVYAQPDALPNETPTAVTNLIDVHLE